MGGLYGVQTFFKFNMRMMNGNFFNKLMYDGWNFNFGNTPLDWIQELFE